MQKIEVEFGNVEQGQARDFRNQINCNFKGQKDAEGNVVTEYGGTLGALAEFPLIGMVLQAFASFAPTVEETIA